MASTLKDKKVLVVGRGSGLARAITQAARAAGATVIVAGRDPAGLAQAYEDDAGVSAESVDLTDDDSIAALAHRVGAVDHVVSTASSRARGMIADLERDAVRRSFDTKVIGPLMLARAFRGQINDGGSIVIFSGVAAFDIEPGTLAVAITNGAAETPHPVAGRRARTDPRQRDLAGGRRHRRLGCARRGRQGEAVRREDRAQPGAADRRARGHRRGRDPRHDQHVHDRPDPPRRRRRAPHMTYKIEVLILPVSDVDRALAFYSEKAGQAGVLSAASRRAPRR